jgi:hypothetical protein
LEGAEDEEGEDEGGEGPKNGPDTNQCPITEELSSENSVVLSMELDGYVGLESLLGRRRRLEVMGGGRLG